ncbi:MAG: helix-turn-helix domain-containing protein [Clostridia bacterium]|nr:helix-turn-helix domain-containing protein [Clostridia bacterium]
MTEDSLGGRMTALLNSQNMTQKELAEKAGITEAAISHYIKGDRYPRSYVLSRIAAVLNTTTDYLIGATGENDEIANAKTLLARNASTMTMRQKKEIMDILFPDD